MKPLITIHNCETQEIIEREMTDEEFSQYEIDQKDSQGIQAKIKIEKAAKSSAQAKLAALGLTDDEVAAIVGN